MQRSADGQTFAALAWVGGAGSSPSARHYEYEDAKPVPGSVGYYRLKQLDADGQATYSPIQAVKYAAATAITAYPNPTTNQVRVAWPASVPVATGWQLTNALGQVLHTESVTAAQGFILDLTPWAAGTYYLTVLAGEHVLGRTKMQKVQ